MALTPSNMLPLGTKAPTFELPDTVSGKIVTLQELQSDTATVVMFICNHCPYVVHIINKLAEVARKYKERGINFIAISSNDVDNFTQDAPDKMTVFAKKHHFTFPYLYDETQEVAKAYQAACTPDFYLFDEDMVLQYRGRFDASTPGNSELVTGSELTDAIDNLLNGNPINEDQKPSVGCNIKWKNDE